MNEIKNEEKVNWEIELEDYSLTPESQTVIHKMWKSILKPFIQPNQNILIINGGDQVLRQTYISSVSTTICDPNAFRFCEDDVKDLLNTSQFVNTIDSLSYVNKLTLVDMTFLEAIEDECFKSKFDIIFVANDYTEDSSEITSKLFVEYLYYYLKDSGLLFYQIPKDRFSKNVAFKTSIEYYFTELNKRYKFVPTYNKHVSFATYRKFSTLV